MYNYVEELVFWILQATIIFILIITALFLLFLLIFRILGRQIEQPLVQALIDFFGLYYLDNSQITQKFRSILKVIDNKFQDYRLVLLTGLQDLNSQLLEKNSISSVNSEELKVTTFGGSICMQVSSEVFMKQEFTSIANLIQYYRNQVPINALVLTVSLKDLDATLSNKLDIIIKQLRNLDGYQSYPVYILFDDLGSLPGFNSLLSSLTQDEQSIIFGYTIPNDSKIYDKNQYSPSSGLYYKMIDHIVSKFEEMVDFKIQQQVFDSETISELLTLGNTLQNLLTANLKTILTSLFYNDSNNFLRGIYFCDSELDAFCNNLFLKLILVENMVRPKRFSIRSFFVRNLFLFILTCLLLCLPFTHHKLSKSSLEVNTGLVNIKSIQKNENSYTALNKFINSTKQILENIPQSVFIPLSWFGNLKSDLHNIIKKYYQRLFIDQIYSKYNNELELVSSSEYSPDYELEQGSDSLFNTPQFLRLYNMSTKVADLESIYASLLKFNVTSSIEDLNSIVKHLFQFELPMDILTSIPGFQPIFAVDLNKLHKIDDHKYAIQEAFLSKFTTFLSHYRDFGGFFGLTDAIAKNLRFIKEDSTSYGTANLNELLNLLKQVHDFLKSSNATYVRTDFFVNEKSVVNLIDILKNTKSFNDDFTAKILNQLKNENLQLRNKVFGLDLPIFGPICKLDADGNPKLTQSFEDLLSILTQVKESEFLLVNNRCNLEALNPDLAGINALSWNVFIVKNLLYMIEMFNSNLKLKLSSLSLQVRAYIIRVLLNVFNDKLENDLALSLEPANFISTSETMLADYRLTNAVETFPALSSIYGFAQQNQLLPLYFKLTKILATQYEQLLTIFYKLLEDQNVYVLNQNALLNPAIDEKFTANFIRTSRTELSKLFEKIKPIVQFLESMYKSNNSLQESEIFRKWQEIKLYFDLSADTSLEELDLFFTQILNSKTVSQLHELVSSQKNTDATTFLGQRKKSAIQIIDKKIQVYLSSALQSIYAKVADNFNVYLKGFFPFADNAAPDISRPSLLAFYNFWISQQIEIDNVLSLFKDDPKINLSLEYLFLTKMKKAMMWISHFLYPTIFHATANLQIRVLRDQESLVDQLSIWKIAFYGTNKLLINPNDNQVTEVYSGSINQSLLLPVLTFANMDMVQKISAGSQYAFKKSTEPLLNGFSYSSNFAFLRFIRLYFSHQANDLIYLKFNYPVIGTIQNKDSIQTKEDHLISYMSIRLDGVEYVEFPTTTI